MNYPSALQRGVLVSRYKRFFADVVLDDGSAVTAHCPNPGAMLGLNRPGQPVWISRSDDPKRKLRHTLELVGTETGLVGINTLAPNRLTAEALACDAIPELAGYPVRRREVRYGAASRVDFLLEDGSRPRCWLEVKAVTLCRSAGLAEFPDCVSARGARHLRELTEVVRSGDRAAVLFVIQRDDCRRAGVARDLDPVFAAAFDQARADGVEVYAYGCDIGLDAVTLGTRLPWAD